MTPMEIIYKRGPRAFDVIDYPTWVWVLFGAITLGCTIQLCISFFRWKRNNFNN